MKLKSITIKNFKGIEHREFTLDPALTIITSERNGEGKTRMLDAVSQALHPFLNALNKRSKQGVLKAEETTWRRPAEGPQPDVVTEIRAAGSLWSTEEISWSQTLTVKEVATSTYRYGIREDQIERKGTLTEDDGTGSLRTIAQGGVVSGAIMPIVRYEQLERINIDTTLGKASIKALAASKAPGRFDSYESSLGKFTLDEFLIWYKHLNDATGNALELDDAQRSRQLAFVQHCVTSLVQPRFGWHTLRYQDDGDFFLYLQHPEKGIFPLTLLSRSEIQLVMLAADLAYRACSLNPAADDYTQVPGVVLIDAVEAGIDVSGQRTILSALLSTFPNVQFIVTTSSPFVSLSALPTQLRIISAPST